MGTKKVECHCTTQLTDTHQTIFSGLRRISALRSARGFLIPCLPLIVLPIVFESRVAALVVSIIKPNHNLNPDLRDTDEGTSLPVALLC
jgi:hypothetical protein